MFTGSLRDITQRRHAEERIRSQAALLDKGKDAILVRDMQDQIVYWNQGAEHLYGWAAAEAVGRNANDLLSRKPSQELEEAHRTVIAKGEWTGELRQSTKDNKEVIVESRWPL